jgi:predicted amidohydrolase
MREINIGILQFGSLPDKERTFKKIDALLKPKKADIIIMPEYTLGNPIDMTPSDLIQYAEDIYGESSRKILKYSTEFGTTIIAGMFEKVDNGVYNIAVKFSPDGEIKPIYRKVHLFNAYGYRETDYFKAGDKPSEIFSIKGVRLAVAICFDIRFPELFRYYSLNGAEVILIPAGWVKGPMKEETLRFLARARAHENVLYLVLSVQYGKDYTGRSMIIDPLGTVVHELGIGEKYSEYTIDIDEMYKVREFLPLLKLRRPDLYREWGI